MKNAIHFYRNKSFQGALTAFLILYQMIRLIAFVNVYGGLENDGGWFLGVARSLAEKGIYTTMVSTLPDPNVKAGPDINQEFFQLQDEDGRIFFFVEGTVGPTRIIPDAIIIKLFGSGFWQFRTASLLFYLLFLILASGLLLSTGGLLAVLLFHAYLFFYPHLSVFLGYEALGEVPVITCVLFSFALYARATTSSTNRTCWFFLSGLIAGLAIMSKLISLLSLTGLGFLWLILYLQQKTTLKEGLITVAGVVFLPLAWVLTQLITIIRLFGLDTYVQHAQQRLNFFSEGSGIIGEHTTETTHFFWHKFFLISEISHPNPVLSSITLIVVAIGGPFLMWHFRRNQLRQNLAILLWGGWLGHTLWFIIRAENGWVRRYWVALILAILLLSLLWSVLLHQARMRPTRLNLSLVVVMTFLIGVSFYSQLHTATFFMSDSLIEYWYQKHLAAARTRLPWIIVPRTDQEAAVTALQQLPDSARIFYLENYKSAEMAALSGRIFYPIQRRQLMPPAEDDVVLVGPSVISRWRKPAQAPTSQVKQQAFIDEILKRVKRDCPHLIFENSNYIICALD